MQPASQSPQPIVTVTTNAPTPDAGWTSYQPAWPMRSGSFGPSLAKRGSVATTAAQASAGVVTLVTGLGEGLGVEDGALDAHPMSQMARTRSSDR